LGFSLARLPRNFAHLIVEKVALSTDSDFPCISIRFQDNTDLTFMIDPWLTSGRLFEVEGREPEGAQALAGGSQRWHMREVRRDRDSSGFS